MTPEELISLLKRFQTKEAAGKSLPRMYPELESEIVSGNTCSSLQLASSEPLARTRGGDIFRLFCSLRGLNT